MTTKSKTAITPEQALNNFRLLTELSARNSYAAFRAAVNEICEEVLSRGIAVTIPTSKFPLPDYDAGVCEAGPSIGYNRDLSPVEVCEAFAANPKAMHIEMPGGWQVRSAVEGEGLWRVCRDAKRRIGKTVSTHTTFAEAVEALNELMRSSKRDGAWSIYCGQNEEPWQGGGVSSK